MRKIILSLTIALTVFTSCEYSGDDENKCLNSVIKAYPNSDIYVDLEKPFVYYVIDSNGFLVVETGAIKSPDITSVVRLSKIQDR